VPTFGVHFGQEKDFTLGDAMSDPTESPFPILRFLVSLGLIAVLVLAGRLAFLHLSSLYAPPEKTAVAQPRTAVRVMTVSRQDYTEVISGYGLARALRLTDVQAEVVGLVKWISPDLEAGEAVEEGAVLVKLDDRDLVEAVTSGQAALEEAEAAVESLRIDLEGINRQLIVAREEYDASKRELERVQKLAESGNVALSAVDRQVLQTSLRERAVLELEMRERANRPAMDRAQAAVKLRKSQLAQARNNLSRAEIKAPYAGRIEERYVQFGTRVGPGSPLFRILDLSVIEVAIALGASHFGDVAAGSKASISLTDNGPVVWAGEIARLSPSVDSQDRTFQAFLEVKGDGNGAVIPPGGFVVAEIEGPAYENVIVVPRAAFLQRKLFVAERPNGSEGEAVVRERRPDVRKVLADVVLIHDGIQPGEEIVLTNVEEIADDSRVLLVTDGAPPGATPSGEREEEGPR